MRTSSSFAARIFAASFLLVIMTMQPAAQRPVLPVPPEPQIQVDMWAVTLTPGADPYAIAQSMGLVVGGELAGTPNTYIFRGSGQLKAITNSNQQAFSANMARSPEIISVQPQVLLNRVTRGVEDTITDPQFPNQWHLNNTGQFSGTAGADAKVFAAWNAGYTGTGIVVSSVDDGVYHANPDLVANYLPSASWDYVNNDSDPSGGGHGTSVAGVMAADNDGAMCGVGAAFNAKLSGIQLLNAGTDANEAAALTYANQVIDIYNNSWGPTDNGATLEAPGPLAEAAILNGITNGRGGLGSIYVWAAGNGKANKDNTNADGYANSRYTISVAATTNTGTSSSYSEHGSPNLINAPSNGGTAGIYTTGYSVSTCNSSFGGTSSAAPLVSGVIALILEANPNLTWRDVQHILVQTADKNDPAHADWQTNGAGRDFNHYYGFGRIDAGEAVVVASTWQNIGAEQTIDSGVISANLAIPDGAGPSTPGAFVESTFNISGDLTMESVDVFFTAAHTWRGDLEIELVSPSGTRSVLMPGRANDSGDNYTNWRFNTVANWGESSVGVWTLRVRDRQSPDSGTLNSWQLKIHGTTPVATSLAITKQPENQSVLYNELVVLTTQAAGDAPYTYQWYEGASGDTSTPVGTNSASFAISALQANASYWVRITGASLATIDSNAATVTALNEWGMLVDPSFSIVPSTSWIFSSKEGRIRCDKQYVSANCAAILRNNTPEKLILTQDVNLTDYPWSLQIGDTLTMTGQIKAMKPDSKGNIRIVIRYTDGTKTVIKNPAGATETWQSFTLGTTIERTDISRIFVRVVNSTIPLGVNMWVDDIQLTQGRGPGGTRYQDAGEVLPPPAAPEDFRGNN